MATNNNNNNDDDDRVSMFYTTGNPRDDRLYWFNSPEQLADWMDAVWTIKNESDRIANEIPTVAGRLEPYRIWMGDVEAFMNRFGYANIPPDVIRAYNSIEAGLEEAQGAEDEEEAQETEGGEEAQENEGGGKAQETGGEKKTN